MNQILWSTVAQCNVDTIATMKSVMLFMAMMKITTTTKTVRFLFFCVHNCNGTTSAKWTHEIVPMYVVIWLILNQEHLVSHGWEMIISGKMAKKNTRPNIKPQTQANKSNHFA